MPDIDFAAFNNRSFEQFTQALASNILGPGILIFGDGPDGGREAAVRGKVPYPTMAAPWDGYTVLQAKFRDRPTRDTGDVDWLVGQLRQEADKWTDDAPVPEYYILATNIRLSGVFGKSRKGGQQKIDEAFDRHLKPLGVKEMHVWHEQKIATLVDLCPNLLRSYKAWLGPRDVLAAVFESFERETPEFGETMLRFLQRELRDDRSTRMRQAGHVDEESTPLESVFVDLPYQFDHLDQVVALRNYHSAVTPGGAGRGDLLHVLLSATSLKLDPETLSLTWRSAEGPTPARQLILGGPGQGKSTVTQFLAQIARWRLLRDMASEKLSPDTASTLAAIGARLAELNVPVDGPPRYPLRVDLPTFADELAKSADGGLSILEYLARRIAKLATDPRITAVVMRQWLGAYPWLLLFDGLDEVPPSSNRREVLRAMEEFWDEATPLNSDVAVIVTSRPQGYNDDLSPELYVKLEMAKLDPVRALAYAERMALRKIPGQDQRDRVLGRLRDAAAHETTALLMVSPLQVAILLQLIDQRGSAPSDRWSLFNDYLGVVVKREQEKLGEAGRVIRERERVIDGLLRRVGLLLHVEAEHSGGSEAYLTPERMAAIASDLLEEDGHTGPELENGSAEIVNAATQRLVFLQQRVEGRIEFEVRSLQEFMAAAELMAGGDGEVGERLREIGGRTHWQHVYRIAASKAFAVRDAGKYRDAVISINREIDAHRLGALPIRQGAATAMDLLADGLAHDQPRYRTALALHAFELTALGPEHVDRRLGPMLTSFDAEFARKALASGIVSGQRQQRLACWTILLRAAAADRDWVDQLIGEWWPQEPSRLLEIISCGVIPQEGTIGARRYLEALRASRPMDIRGAVWRGESSRERQHAESLSTNFKFLAPVLKPGEFASEEVTLFPEQETALTLKVVTLDKASRSGSYSEADTGRWEVTAPIRHFVEAPSTTTLAAFAERLSDPELIEYLNCATAPWVLLSVAYTVEDGLSPGAAAQMAREGEFGDLDAWKRAETRWQEKGIVERDLELWRSRRFFDAQVAEVGAPQCFGLAIENLKNPPVSPDWLVTLAALAEGSEAGAPLDLIHHILRFVLHRRLLPERLSSELCLSIAFFKRRAPKRFVEASILSNVKSVDLSDRAFLETLADFGTKDRYSIVPKQGENVDRIAIEIARSAPDLAGLLTLALSAGTSDAGRIVAIAQALEDLVGMAPGREGAAEPTIIALSLALGRTSARDAAASLVQSDQQSLGLYAALALACSEEMPDEDAVSMLSIFITHLDDAAGPIRNSAIGEQRRRVDRQTSRLLDVDCWRRLALPPTLFRCLTPRSPDAALVDAGTSGDARVG